MRGMKITDLTGQKFGKLTVIERAKDYISPKGAHQPMWLCQCECGKQAAIRAYSIKAGKLTSCGCDRYRRSSLGNKTKAIIRGNSKKGNWTVYLNIGEFDNLKDAIEARNDANKEFEW